MSSPRGLRLAVPLLLCALVLALAPSLTSASSWPRPEPVFSWPTSWYLNPPQAVSALGMDSYGRIYAANNDNLGIIKYSLDGEVLELLPFPGGTTHILGDIAVDLEGNIWCTDRAGRLLLEFDSDANLLHQWGYLSGTSGGVSLTDPFGVAIGPNGHIFLTDAGANHLLEILPDGTLVRVIGSPGSSAGQFMGPAGIAFDRFGNFYVADSGNGRIQKFDGQGSFLLQWSGTSPVTLGSPFDIAIDDWDHVFVVDNGTSSPAQVCVFTCTGAYVTNFTGGIISPGAVAVRGRTGIFVSERDGSDPSIVSFGYPPMIISIQDVPDDQGRWVRLTFGHSIFDSGYTPDVITGYAIYRQQPEGASKSAAEAVALPPAYAQHAVDLEGWDALTVIPARRDSTYETVLPTLCDSTASGGIEWSTFLVSALTCDNLFYDSYSASGYSVDNIAPPTPSAPQVAEVPGLLQVSITWDASAAPDLDHYAVYRSASDDPGNLPSIPLATTTSLSYLDETVQPGETWYYWIVAYDDAGLSSPLSPSASVTVVTSAEPPSRKLVLQQNVPNPFNPSTAIAFTLPQAQRVRLKVFDRSGRYVATLYDDVAPQGETTVQWEGVDEGGRLVASGVYLYRLESGETSQTRRMTLVR